MDTQNFEEKLTKMTKPVVNQLKHQDMLVDAIAKAKDKSIMSWWWLIIPLYIISALLMKSLYMPHSTFISNIHDLTTKQKFTSAIFFLILPVVFIIINLLSIRKVNFLSGSPGTISFLKTVWFSVLIILFSILILIIYSL
jgi:hypothetical protein